MQKLYKDKYLIIGSDLAMSYNTKRIYGIYYYADRGHHYFRKAYETEQGRLDAMRDIPSSFRGKGSVFFVDVLYIEEKDWPNHPLYKEVTDAGNEEHKRIKSEHDSKLKEMIKTNPCKALSYYKYDLTFWQKIYCKIQCYAKKL